MRVAFWSPCAGRGWPAALVPHLEREVELELLAEEPSSDPTADCHVYHLVDDPAHGYVYRALLRRPGLVVLEDWGLHRLVHAAIAGSAGEAAYRREARREHGELGAFVAGQVTRGLGGVLPASFLVMNDRVLEAGLAFVATSEAVRSRLAARRPDGSVAHLPLCFQAPPPLRVRDLALSTLGVPPGSLLVLAIQPSSSDAPPPRVARALDEVHRVEPQAMVRWTPEDHPELAWRLAAADVVVALEHPPRAGLGAAVPLAVASGKAPLVSAGSGAAREMPEGVVARVSPGPTEAAETAALVRRLLADEPLRSRMGRLARAYATDRRDPGGVAQALLGLLRTIEPIAQEPAARRTVEGSPAGRALDEVAVAARELGLDDPRPVLSPLVAALFGEGVS